MFAQLSTGETVTLQDSAFLANILEPGNAMPTAETPIEIKVSAEVRHDQLQALSKIALLGTQTSAQTRVA